MPILINRTEPHALNARFEKTSPVLIGSTSDADLCLGDRAVSAHHCWIERHPDGFHLVDLNTTNGSYVNGEKVSDALLNPGDVLRLGRVELEFQLTANEKAEFNSSVVKEDEPGQLVKMESVTVTMPDEPSAVEYARRCHQCGASIPSSANFCPRCGLSSNAVGRPVDPFVQPVEGPGLRGPGILPMLALICGLVGPLLLGVGWLLGIILGLMAMAVIRRTGGFERDRRQAIWGIGAGIAWAVLIFTSFAAWWWMSTTADRRELLDKQIAQNEQAAIAELSDLGRAEKYAKTILFSDANHNNIGEYVKWEKLDTLESPFVNHALASKGEMRGYRFVTTEASETRFFAVAVPQRYGHTGKRTFAIDQTGVLRATEAKGGTFTNPSQLAPLPLPDIFETTDDEIAEAALAVARNLGKSGDYETSRAILDDLRAHYTLTRAGTQLTDLEKTIDPFLIEARADRKFRDALAAREKGDLVLSIALLKDVTLNHSTFSKIHDATKLLQELEVQYAQSQEERARALFEKAEALERDGKVAEAEAIYFQIEKGFPGTQWAQQVLSVKPALQRQLREKQVEGWLQQLSSLSPETDYDPILNLVDQLRRNYADTTAYQEATDSTSELQSLKVVEQKARASKLRIEAMRQVQAGQLRRALTSLEKAIAEDPDLAVHLRETLWDLYPRVVENLLAEHDTSGAMALYEKFLKLNPPENKLNRTLFAELSYQVGQTDLLGGRTEAALPRFQQAEAVYRNDANFNALYGRTLCRMGRFEEGIARFDAAAQVASSTNALLNTIYYWRAWAWLHLAESLEVKLRIGAGLPSLAPMHSDLDRMHAEPNDGGPVQPGSATNRISQVKTNPAINFAQPDSATPLVPPPDAGAGAKGLDSFLSGSLELVADIEAARVDFGRQEMTTHGDGDKVNISSRFDKAQRIQQFRDRVSTLRQMLLGAREHQRVVGEHLQQLLDAYTRAQADIDKGAKLNETGNPLLAQSSRLVLPGISDRAGLYRTIVPALIRVRRDDLKVADTSLELAEQSINQLQWNLKGGLNISKAVEENFRRLRSRKVLDEAVAAFDRFDEKKIDLAELWRRNSLPDP